jgi:hypothetical protein
MKPEGRRKLMLSVLNLLCEMYEIIILKFFTMRIEHERTLHFQNGTENRCGILRTSHPYHHIEKFSKLCFK